MSFTDDENKDDYDKDVYIVKNIFGANDNEGNDEVKSQDDEDIDNEKEKGQNEGDITINALAYQVKYQN